MSELNRDRIQGACLMAIILIATIVVLVLDTWGA